MIDLANFFVFNIAKQLGWETFWDSVKFTWDSTFVDALGPRDAIEIKPKSNTGVPRVFMVEILCALTVLSLRVHSTHSACAALSWPCHCADTVLKTQ